MPQAPPQGGRQHADESAVEGHAAVPYPEHFQGIGQVGVEIVKQDITQSRAQHHAEHGPGGQVVHLVGGPARARPRGSAAAQQPSRQKGRYIHDAVPVQAHRAKGNGNGIDGGVGQHGGLG